MHLRAVSIYVIAALLGNFGVRGSRKIKKRGYVINRPKPNIIFMMADDLDVTLGSPEVMIKTKRYLRDEGVTFSNAFTTSPLCCPSRSSILTGRYAHNHNVNTNNKNCSGPAWINGAEKETFGTLMQGAGYKTAYFGKYLNNYDGERVPPGWNDWSGLIKNSRYYNYSLNINGKIVRHGSDYKKDYFTDLMARDSANYFKNHIKTSSRPLFMVVSMAAPHGPEDAAPQYQNHFENITAPRYPNYNYTSLDKHWIIRNTPSLDNLRSQFTDALYRKRLQTLLSVDDAVEKIYLMLVRTRQLDNTYIMFTSDHGYHLGQFNQVKGKAQPYESDVRIPFYIRGPKIPKGVLVPEIALNIDFVPTFLDIARAKVPKSVDGTSVMDVAVGKVINWRKRKVLKPIWRDTFLIERGKLHKNRTKTKSDEQIERLVFYSAKKVQRICSKRGYPKPPCTKEKKLICYSKNGTMYLERCKQESQQNCLCTQKKSKQIVPKDETNYLLLELEKQFERLKRRIKRHGVKGLQKFSSNEDKPILDFHMQSVNLSKVPNENQKAEEFLDRKIAKSMQRIRQWRKERSKITKNRKLKTRLALTLAEKVQKLSNTTCACTTPIKKKKKKSSQGRDMSCFHFDKYHWKSPPLWTGPSFTACTNSPNSSYWCLRTINTTHNFLYCEFVTGFKEYFNVMQDPYQLVNKAAMLSKDELHNLHSQLQYMRACSGSKECFLRAGENLFDRRDTLRKMRRYERRKRHGILIRGNGDDMKGEKDTGY